MAFYAKFPAFATNDLYLTGESYAGQYVPNIAYWITENAPKIPLKGIAVGNGCWGGDATNVDCNGANSDQNDLDMYFGKGLVSKPLYVGALRGVRSIRAAPRGLLHGDRSTGGSQISFFILTYAQY